MLIVSDDMNPNDVGYHGSEIRTPNIDRLAAEGVELDRFYAFPVCSPTWTALMTGRSAIRYGILRPLGTGSGLPAEKYLLPRAFQEAGYQTWLTGKWHLGAPGEKGMPHHRGFNHFYGFLGGFVDYYRHTSTRIGRLDWQRNGEPLQEEGYATDLLTDETLRLLDKRDQGRPLFPLSCIWRRAFAPSGSG